MKLSVKLLSLVLFLYFPFCLALPEAFSGEKGLWLTDEIQLKIADAFMEEGEYYRAITEYKKLLILFPDSEKADYALVKICAAYYNGEEYESSLRSFSSLKVKYPKSKYVPDAMYLEGLSYWKLKNLAKAVSTFDVIAETFPRSEYAPLALVAGSLAALDEEKIHASTGRLTKLIDRYPEHPGAKRAGQAIPLINRYQKLPHKSKVLAAVMSALIPGSGYVYAGRYWDGLSAFVINALFIAGTITAIHAENYPVAGIVGGAGLPFYFGNIYGSANAAKKWNLNVKLDLKDRVYVTLDFKY
jgi:tetratricopeptide (TPR) repeat protein